MIVKLRKRHFYTWVLLALVLPALIILAYTNVSEKKADDFSIPQMKAFTDIVSTDLGEYVMANLRKQTDRYQLEVVILKPIQSANTTLKIKSGNSEVNLGQLRSKGLYRFPIPETFPVGSGLGITIYDQIKKTEIEKITIEL